MIECFIADSEMTFAEPVEWIDYNVMGVMGGKGFTVIYSEETILWGNIELHISIQICLKIILDKQQDGLEMKKQL